MKPIVKKILIGVAILLVVAVATFLIVYRYGKVSREQYGVGLTEDGYYEDLTEYASLVNDAIEELKGMTPTQIEEMYIKYEEKDYTVDEALDLYIGYDILDAEGEEDVSDEIDEIISHANEEEFNDVLSTLNNNEGKIFGSYDEYREYMAEKLYQQVAAVAIDDYIKELEIDDKIQDIISMENDRIYNLYVANQSYYSGNGAFLSDLYGVYTRDEAALNTAKENLVYMVVSKQNSFDPKTATEDLTDLIKTYGKPYVYSIVNVYYGQQSLIDTIWNNSENIEEE